MIFRGAMPIYEEDHLDDDLQLLLERAVCSRCGHEEGRPKVWLFACCVEPHLKWYYEQHV